MKRNWLLPLLAIFALSLLAACGMGGANGDAVPEDPYADLDTTPPAPIPAEEQTIAPAFSLGTPDDDGIIEMNITGVDVGTGTAGVSATSGLSSEHFTVVEGETVKGITVERIGEGETRAAADIMFVLDTTASMGSGLNSVAVSVAGFLDYLDGSGLDAHVGAITFGDAYDTVLETGSYGGESFMNETPPSFDSEERSSFALSADFDAFRKYLIGDITDEELGDGHPVTNGQARGGGRYGGDGPENSLGSVEYAYDTEAFGWRTGAQKIFIVITDICSHNDETFELAFKGHPDYEKWAPSSAEDVIKKLRGNAVVHVVSPSETGCGETYTDMASLTGSAGLGGVHVPWDLKEGSWAERPSFDLTDLPIAGAVSSGYVLKYRGTVDGKEKSVRLVIDDGAAHRGDITRVVTY